MESERQDAFVKVSAETIHSAIDSPGEAIQLKSKCVPLFGLTGGGLRADRELVRLLGELNAILQGLGPGIMSNALANYVLYPLISLVKEAKDHQLSDRASEQLMLCLAHLLGQWPGAESKLVSELWLLCVLLLDAEDAGASDETRNAIVLLLQTLMDRPREDAPEDDFLGDNIDWTAEDPYAAPEKTAAPSDGVLFHTLNVLLSYAKRKSSQDLAVFGALETLVAQFMAHLLPTCLPGITSTLSKLIVDATRPRLVVACLQVLKTAWVLALGDQVTRHLRKEAKITSLSDLSLYVGSSEKQESKTKETVAFSHPKITIGPTSSTRSVDSVENSPQEARGSKQPQKGPGTSENPIVTPTPAWLEYTLKNISQVMASFSVLRFNDSVSVRTAYADFLAELFGACRETLGEKTIIQEMAFLLGDTDDDVSEAAKAFFARSSQEHTDLSPLKDVVRSALLGLPPAALKHNEKQVATSARVLAQAIKITSQHSFLSTEFERWFASVSKVLQFDRLPRDASLPEDSYAPLRMRHIQEKETLRALEQLFYQIGYAGDAPLVECILQQSQDNASLWILNQIARGLASRNNKGTKKIIRGITAHVLSLLDQIEQEEDQEDGPAPSVSDTQRLAANASPVDENVLIATRTHETSLLPDLDRVKAVKLHTEHDVTTHAFVRTCLVLEVLTTTSSYLGTSFQSYVMRSLYHVLKLTSSENAFVRNHAHHCLSTLSQALSFVSVETFVLANTDYVVNAVSQRLSITRLSAGSPLVLVQMIQIVGPPILPMVHDMVYDLFDAIDDYHGYDEVTLGLWAVLDALIQAMAESMTGQEKKNIIQTRNKEKTMDYQNSEAWSGFLKFLACPEEELPDEYAFPPKKPFADANPERPFTSDHLYPEAENAGGFPQSLEEKEEKTVPPTQAQKVAHQILSKSVFFLSHASPFLRARILTLMANIVPIMGGPSLSDTSKEDRPQDLLPLIDTAWPYILNRFNDSELFVVTAAASLIESLSLYAGQFMSKRILDDVWPVFKKLLQKQTVYDAQSAISVAEKYSTSNKLYSSMVVTLTRVAMDVSVKEDMLWEMCLLLRRFLSTQFDPSLQKLAIDLFTAMASVNPDLVWVVLCSCTRMHREIMPEYLIEETGLLSDNAQHVLDTL